MFHSSRRDFLKHVITPFTLSVAACSPSATGPDAIANTYMDAYYARYDIAAALKLSDGPLKEKLETQLSEANEAGAINKKPEVHIKLKEKKEESEEVREYEFLVSVSSPEKITSRVFLKLRKNDKEKWHVAVVEESQMSQ